MRVVDIDVNRVVARTDMPASTLNDQTVSELATSIEQIGLLSPVIVRPTKRFQSGVQDDAFEILAGRHRLAAFLALGRATIPALIADVGDLKAEQIELEENLRRNTYSPAQRASMTKRLKLVYEAQYPETAHGGDRRSSRQIGDLKVPTESQERFTKRVARAIGKPERAIQRDAARGEALSGVQLDRVAGTSLDKGEELDALARLPEEKRIELIDRALAGEKVSAKVELKKDSRAAREQILGGIQHALPNKRFGVILADPEWRFEVYSRETGMDRAADNHYPTSVTDAICQRDVASIAADDCVLFLWATAPMLPDALKVMAAWGFTYKSHIIWQKTRESGAPFLGTGYWFRNAHELMLVGTKGKVPAPAMGTQEPSVLEAPIGAHSAKPEIFLELIETYFPTLPKIELNRRGPARQGWDAWGNEAVDPATGEVIEPETQRDDTAEVHRVGEFVADYSMPTPEELAVPEGIPDFLRRQAAE